MAKIKYSSEYMNEMTVYSKNGILHIKFPGMEETFPIPLDSRQNAEYELVGFDDLTVGDQFDIVYSATMYIDFVDGLVDPNSEDGFEDSTYLMIDFDESENRFNIDNITGKKLDEISFNSYWMYHYDYNGNIRFYNYEEGGYLSASNRYINLNGEGLSYITATWQDAEEDTYYDIGFSNGWELKYNEDDAIVLETNPHDMVAQGAGYGAIFIRRKKLKFDNPHEIFTDVLIMNHNANEQYNGHNEFSMNAGEMPIECAYLPHPVTGDIVPTLFTVNNEYPDYPDYSEQYYYSGQYTLDGTVYDKWDKYEGTDYRYSVLTNIVVG